MECPQSQTDSHILKHTIQNVRFSSKKEEQISVSTQPSKQAFVYPMVEPLEFHTNDFSRVSSGKNQVNFRREEKNKKVSKVISMVDKETQTSTKPLLQYRSEETDLYNCFDSVFNGKGFQKKDIVDRNVGLASKRQLNDW